MSALSVVMANYNHGRFLRESLGAIVSQSLKPKEVIVVDDASTDDSVAVISEFVRDYPFVRLLQNDRNRGMVPTLNRGLREASGDYVTYPGADDRVLPGLFEKSMALLERYPQAGLCTSLARLLSPEGRDLGPYHIPRVSETPCFIPAERVRRLFLRHGNWMVSYSAIHKRLAVLEAGGHPEILAHAADGFLLFHNALKYGACFIPEELVMWRRMETGLSLAVGRDLDRAVQMAEDMEKRMFSAEFKEVFPPDFVAANKRSSLQMMIYELTREEPFAAREVLRLMRRLGAARPVVSERLYRLALRLLASRPRAARLASKLYLFWRQVPEEKLRIARRCLLRLAGRQVP